MICLWICLSNSLLRNNILRGFIFYLYRTNLFLETQSYYFLCRCKSSNVSWKQRKYVIIWDASVWYLYITISLTTQDSHFQTALYSSHNNLLFTLSHDDDSQPSLKGLWNLIITQAISALPSLILYKCHNTMAAQGHDLHLVKGCVNRA